MNFGAPAQMIDVSDQGIVCSVCGTPITELPFQPTAGREVQCRDCHRNARDARGGGSSHSPRRSSGGGGGFGGGARPQREMIDVTDMNITCASCGKAITELPFQPDPSRQIFCRDCFRK